MSCPTAFPLPYVVPASANLDLSRLFGFLFGVTLAGASAYYYVIDEYKLSNDMLTEDIYVRQPFPFVPSIQELSPSLVAGLAASLYRDALPDRELTS